ncbi:putative srpk [Hibiscus syriacus]|uniref:Srpk n=1 Tax=Hibiscus syriacus TaxID=106335 RepID=A0A6A3AVS3_HIBSY|nr:putative srpk [Hibiscus syriacus]
MLMEANSCDINHLDADVLLPPRKRLLAGFKKQASNASGASDQLTVASSSSSPPPPPPPSPSPSPSPSTLSSDVNAHLKNLLMSSHLYNPNLSPEEILEASRAAATSAAKAAVVARAAAEEKAAIATKAVAAAKIALDMPIESPRTDEELARKLHQAINSSLRISKNSPSEWRGHKHKRPKIMPTLEKTKASNGGIVLGGSPSSTYNGGTIAGEIDSEDSMEESVKAEAKDAKYEKSGQSELDNGEAKSSHSKEKAFEEVTPGKRRGRMKLKRLPLSICSFRDRVNPKEDIISKGSPLTEKNMDNSTAAVKTYFTLEPSNDGVISIEGSSMRKCQDFKVPACIKQSKVMQS